MNKFSYYIKTHFIPSNKYYNSYRTLHLVYQTYLKSCKSLEAKTLIVQADSKFIIG